MCRKRCSAEQAACLFIVVCIMLTYGLSLQSCRVWQIFYKAYWTKYDCKSVYVYISKTNKQLQKTTPDLIVVIWSYDRFGHLSKWISLIKGRYIIFLSVFHPKSEILFSVKVSREGARAFSPYSQFWQCTLTLFATGWCHHRQSFSSLSLCFAPQSAKYIFDANICLDIGIYRNCGFSY